MSVYQCEDCEKTYQSIKAAMLCKCDKYDAYGRPLPIRGHQWLP